MAKPILIFSLSLLFSLSFPSPYYARSSIKRAKNIGQKSWCVANPFSGEPVLNANIEYACSEIDCRLIQPDGPCFEPDTRMHHASFAMNLYYQARGRHLANCDFRNSGLISLTDPSHDNCTFPSGGGIAEQEPMGRWCVAKPGTSDEQLQQNINFACNHVDCSPTHSGGACFYPATLINHASYAMNLYYQSTGNLRSSCDFRNTGLLVSNDPSYGNCTYQTSSN